MRPISCMSLKTHVSPAKYSFVPFSTSTTMPVASPAYVPSPVALDHEQRRRLLAAAIASCRLRRVEAREQPLRERLVRRRGERFRQRVDRRLGHEDVSLRRVARAGAAAGPFEATAARERRAAAVSIDDAELPLVSAVVGRRERVHDVLRAPSVAEERQPLGAVTRIRVRLRRDRADVRFRPRDDAAHREELRLHADSPLACVEIAGGDGIGRDDVTRHT